MATLFTERFRLNKPDFRESPWSAQLNENSDRLDSIIYNALQANNISSYENGIDVEAGQIMYDEDTETFWICRVSHTTNETGSFQDERDEHSTYWTSVQFGLNPRGQWQRDTFYAYYDLAYDANENISGLCLVPHTSPSTGSMRDEADKWVFIIDVQAGGSIGAADVTFDDTNVPFTAANVQIALDETNERIDNAATIVSGLITDVSDLETTVAGHTTSISSINTSMLTKADNLASVANVTTARNNLGLATVASSGAYADLTGKPTLGTAATKNTGTGAGNVVELPTANKLPALDGSALTNLPLNSRIKDARWVHAGDATSGPNNWQEISNAVMTGYGYDSGIPGYRWRFRYLQVTWDGSNWYTVGWAS